MLTSTLSSRPKAAKPGVASANRRPGSASVPKGCAATAAVYIMCFSWTRVRPPKLGLACIRSRTLHSRRAGINMRSVETGPLCSCML